MRVWCLRRDDRRSATLLSLLAHAGPRPESEALPLRWSAVRTRTILFRATKRGAVYERATRLLQPLASDLEGLAQSVRQPRLKRPRHRRARRRAVGRLRLARAHLPSGCRGCGPASRRCRRRQPRTPARSAVELRNPADLRRPASPVRRQPTRQQPRETTPACGALRAIAADQRRGAHRPSSQTRARLGPLLTRPARARNAETQAGVSRLLRRRARALLRHPDLSAVGAEDQWEEAEHELGRRLDILSTLEMSP